MSSSKALYFRNAITGDSIVLINEFKVLRGKEGNLRRIYVGDRVSFNRSTVNRSLGYYFTLFYDPLAPLLQRNGSLSYDGNVLKLKVCGFITLYYEMVNPFDVENYVLPPKVYDPVYLFCMPDNRLLYVDLLRFFDNDQYRMFIIKGNKCREIKIKRSLYFRDGEYIENGDTTFFYTEEGTLVIPTVLGNRSVTFDDNKILERLDNTKAKKLKRKFKL